MDGITGQTGMLPTHNMFAYCMNNPVNMENSDSHDHIEQLINGLYRDRFILENEVSLIENTR